MTTIDLLSESVAAALKRENEEFVRVIGAYSGRLVLYGAGTLGRRILESLVSTDLRPLAFVDRDLRIQGKYLGDIPILSVEQAVARYASNALFVITVFRGAGDQGMQERMAELKARGCLSVVSFLPLAWNLGDKLLPHYGAERPSVLLRERESLLKLNELWADRVSKEIFRAQLYWRLRGDFSLVQPPSPDQYFPTDLFALSPQEKIVDGGAFDGDTLRVAKDNFVKAWAIEPDPTNARRLREGRDFRVEIFECAVGERDGRARFTAVGGVDSGFQKDGELIVDVRRIDSLPIDDATFLKLDVEGAEMAGLKGGVNLLRKTQLLAAVCIYHLPEHFWAVPLFLAQHLHEHSLFLRAHQYDGFELVCYAVPRKRLRSP